MIAVLGRWNVFVVAATITLAGTLAASDDGEDWWPDVDEAADVLETAWQDRHPDAPTPPPCADDQINRNLVEIDPSPGYEVVVASKRFGIALFTASGELLATRDPLGCNLRGHWWINDQLFTNGLRMIQFDGLVLSEYLSSENCNSKSWLTLMRREGDALVDVIRFRNSMLTGCSEPGTVKPFFHVHTTQPAPTGVAVQVDRYANERLTSQECWLERGHVSADCAFLVED